MLNLDDQNFEKEVLKNEGLVLVNFWRPGCKHSLTMELSIEEVVKELENK